MMEKYITPKGKKYLLELGFINDDNTNNFNFAALGIGDSSAAANNGTGFHEANGDNYRRVHFEQEDTMDDTDTSIAISATFDSTNFNPSEPVRVAEIGIVNQDIENNNDTFFAYMSVPSIDKTSNVSLKYTVIITLE